MKQKEQNDHRQASRDAYLEVKEVYVPASHSAGSWAST